MKTDTLDTTKAPYAMLQAGYGRPDLLSVVCDHREIYGRVLAANDMYIGINATTLDQVNAKGQSFRVPEDCILTAIQVMIGAGSVAQSLTARVGTSDDLTSFLAEYTRPVIAEAGKWATILTDRALALSRGTTYYLGLLKQSADDFRVNLNMVDIYAEGSYLGGGTGWATIPVSSWDLNFRIYGELT